MPDSLVAGDPEGLRKYMGRWEPWMVWVETGVKGSIFLQPHLKKLENGWACSLGILGEVTRSTTSCHVVGLGHFDFLRSRGKRQGKM